MRLARVYGNVVATQKDPQLEGIKLRLIRAVNSRGEEEGEMLVALDAVGARVGDLVIYVQSREATLVIQGRVMPSRAGIVGIVDEVQFLDN